MKKRIKYMFVKIEMEGDILFERNYVSMRNEKGMSSKTSLCDSGCVFCEAIRANGKTYGKIIYYKGIRYVDDQRDGGFVFGCEYDPDFDFENYHKRNVLYGHVRWSDVISTPRDKAIRDAFPVPNDAYGVIWVNKFFGKEGTKIPRDCFVLYHPKVLFFYSEKICYNQLLELVRRYRQSNCPNFLMGYVIAVCDAFRDNVIGKSQLDELLDMLGGELY